MPPLPISRSSAVVLSAVLLGAALSLPAQTAAPARPAPPPPAMPAPEPKPAVEAAPEEIVGPVQMRGDTLDAVLTLVAKWTDRSVIRPQALPATEGYTISLPAMPKSEAVLALETMLDLSGIAVTPLGDKFLKVLPLGQAKTEAPQMIDGSTLDLPPSGRVASKLFVLDFLRVGEIKDQIVPLLNPNLGGPVLFEKTNAMLVTDSISNLQRIEQLIKQLDHPVTGGLQPKFYNLVNGAKASDVVNKITAILKPPLSNQLSSATSITADDRTNQIILLSDPRQYPFFDQLISKLDVKADPNTRNEVIYLKHAVAKDVASLLTNLVSGRSQAASRTDQTSARPIPVSVPVGTPAPGPNVPASVQPALASILGGNASADFSNLVTVIADDRSNSIVVSGTADDLRLIKEIVDKVDILLAQVSIQVVIAEVTLSDTDNNGINALNLTFGTDALRGTHVTNFDTTNPASGGANGIAGWNVTSGVVNPLSFQAAMSNVGSTSNVKILSADTIVTTHNKQAEFNVSQKQPIITGSQSSLASTGTTPVATSTFTYQDIGIDVKVTPLIGDDGSIQLNIDQTVDDVIGSVTLDGNPQPIIGHREATSFINVQDGQMIVLGGLQQTKRTADRTKLGFLYEIPILSNLLGARTHEVDRTELLLFVRPHVLSPASTSADVDKSIDSLGNKDQVRQYLQNPGKLPKENLLDRYYK
ncbi:MAG TPA: secretin N-terminal domain-containing protein [Opitutaceae bacterium]|nr:secretin N-terminal domain-containing protein [Opitutaceae bacterium]